MPDIIASIFGAIQALCCVRGCKESTEKSRHTRLRKSTMKSLRSSVVARRSFASASRNARIEAQAQALLDTSQFARAEPLLRARLADGSLSDAARATLLSQLAAAIEPQLPAGDARALDAHRQAASALRACESDVDSGVLGVGTANAGAALLAAGELDEAEPLLECAEAAFERAGAAEHAALATANRAALLAARGNAADALRVTLDAGAALARLVGRDSELYRQVAANAKRLAAKAGVDYDAAADSAALDTADVVPAADDADFDATVAQREQLEQRAAAWAAEAMPGRIDPNGVLMDSAFTRRVLGTYLRREQDAGEPVLDGRLYHWYAREATLHGLAATPTVDDAAADE
eukprot:TRINITY_DN379_c0_g2_i1.p1 TRINITY_DN379_c0_g2~~TRINITY_DN379_c0_g2_i1.p1  ORF type:complete len:350 (-),score=205.21 TRINITY_DN379_c0_g2_i1:26-1075(-)